MRADSPANCPECLGIRRGCRPLEATKSQLHVLAALRSIGTGTVAEVRAQLLSVWEAEPAYTTVLSHLRALRARGWATSTRIGRADRYVPVARSTPWDAASEIGLLTMYDWHDELLRDVAARAWLSPPEIRSAIRVLEGRLGRMTGPRPWAA